MPRSTRLSVEPLEDRSNPSTAYLATDLVADLPGIAPVIDTDLVNAWGISLSPNGGAFWVSSPGAGIAPLYLGDVTTAGVTSPLTKAALEVTIPGGNPTGQVFNPTTEFVVTNGTESRPSIFIFASLTGAITGWNPQVPPPTQARVGFQATDGAVYTGLAMANNGTGNFLYAADFRNGKIDVLNGQFAKTTLAGSFTDPNLPNGYAPYNVAAIGAKLYVTYAQPEPGGVRTGHGRGFVSEFDLNGNFLRRFASRGDLNAPWAVVQAPATFGDFGGAILVGNFGDGRINAYDPATGRDLGTLKSAPGRPVEIDGLWGLAFGNGRTAGDTNTLYYAAGPDDETHGLFGKITANAAGTNPVSAKLVGSDLVINGSRDDDRVTVQLRSGGDQIVVKAGGDEIGRFDAAAVGSIRFTGWAGDDLFVADPRIDVLVVADGGAGNDALTGGGGGNVLVGNTGNDLLAGGSGRDVLVGGDGRDFLFGIGGDDILIGGITTHDTAALVQVQAGWAGPGSYNDRVAAIRAGTGGVPKLDATTVSDDGDRDDLFGGPGLDWYFGAAPDVFHGRSSSEQTN